MSKNRSIRFSNSNENSLNHILNNNKKGFSEIVNSIIEEHFKRSVWVSNLSIENYASITPTELIDRTSGMGYLRTSSTDLKINLYPTSKHDIERNKAIYDYANGDFNHLHDSFVYFGVKFPLEILFYLTTHSYEQFQRAIVGYLAALFWINPDGRSYMEEELESDLLKEVIAKYESGIFKEVDSYKRWEDLNGDFNSKIEWNKNYLLLLKELGIHPTLFRYMGILLKGLRYPFYFEEYLPEEKDTRYRFYIRLRSAYMRDIRGEYDDWQAIVLNQSRTNTNLSSVESDLEPWRYWLQDYCYFHNLE